MDENKNNLTYKEESPFISRQESKFENSLKFGWRKFRPQCLQLFNGPKWFLVGILIFTVLQGIVVMGLFGLTLPSIEKRFSLTAKEMGIIAASNDVSALVVVVFISFYGDYGNKVKWIGGGGLVLAFGSLLYALPHLLIGKYEPTQSGLRGAFCHSGNSTQSQTKCDLESDSRWYYMMIFVIAQLVSGAGTSPFYSLVPAYLDENVHPKSMPIYMGLWTMGTFLGPGVGMIFAGKFLSIYVDIKQPPGLDLKAHDPRWIGAWWLGFLVLGILILVSSLVILGFPRELTGAKELRHEHIKKGNLRKATQVKKPNLRMILPELKNLLTNWTFLFNTLGLTATLLYVGAMMPFFPKILQLKFGLKPEDTGYAMSAMMTPSMAIGVTVGSLVLKSFKLKEVCKKAALFIFILRILGFIGPIIFLVPGCNNLNLAGISSPYLEKIDGVSMDRITAFQKDSLTATCNANCRCSLSRFAPVCGSDNITYFDKCHAGCTMMFPNKTLGNCSCIRSQHPQTRSGTATRGFCDRDCKNLVIFLTISAVNIVFQFMKIVPDKTVTLRCVPDDKRAFATGIQYISMKTLGLLPGPILFGHVVDSYCRLWQDTCGKKGRCFDYDIDKLSYAVLVLGSTITLLSTFFYFLSWYLYKPEEEEEKELARAIQDPTDETKV